MKCAQCDTPIPDDARFCHSCGSQVSDAEGQARASAEMDASSFQHMEELLREDTAGEFEIERPLGKGGMAIVYLATEIHLSRKVAVKVLPPELTFGHGVERFKREAKTAAALDHPNIIPIYRIASGGKIFWYAMKYLEGRSLDDLLRDQQRMSLPETINILEQVADALDYAHEHQVIHRDIKPANVMLDSRNRVIVTDFGIAKALTEGTLTASGSVVGTPYYMSPEQGMGRPVTGAADQYSVGVMAYRMLSGHVPFEGESAVEILHKHCMIAPPPLQSVMPGLPDHVYWAVARSLEKKPENRHASVAALVDALRAPPPEMTMGEEETAILQSYPDMEAPTVLSPGLSDPAMSAGSSRGGMSGALSDAAMSGATVPMDATPPPTPPTPQPAAQPTARPLVGKERKSHRGVLYTAISVIALGTGIGGAYLMFGAGGSQEGETPPAEQGTPANQQTQTATQPEAGPPAVPESTATDTGTPETETAPPVTPPAEEQPPAPQTGTLNLRNVPAGATVLVDNQRQSGGGSIELEAGRSHRVVVRADGYEQFDRTVPIRAGQTANLTFNAQRVRAEPEPPPTRPAETRPAAVVQGLLRVVIRPPADEVVLDGLSLGAQSRLQELVIGGSHPLVIRKDGYVTKDTTVTVAAGDTVLVQIVLERNN